MPGERVSMAFRPTFRLLLTSVELRKASLIVRGVRWFGTQHRMRRAGDVRNRSVKNYLIGGLSFDHKGSRNLTIWERCFGIPGSIQSKPSPRICKMHILRMSEGQITNEKGKNPKLDEPNF